MHYYEKKRRALMALNEYLDKESRPPFTTLGIKMGLAYGFDTNTMKKMLETFYPELTVVDDKVVALKDINESDVDYSRFG